MIDLDELSVTAEPVAAAPGEPHPAEAGNGTGGTPLVLDRPEPPAPPQRRADPVFTGDLSPILEDDTRAPDAGGRAGASAPAGLPPADRSFSGDELPFPATPRARVDTQPDSLVERAWVAIELAWFRRRRGLASLAAVLGVLAIAAVAMAVVARELGSRRTETEGVPVAPSTIPDVVPAPTAVPFVIDPPQTNTTTTTTAAPRRRATRPATSASTAPTATTAGPATTGPTTPSTHSSEVLPPTSPGGTDDEPTATAPTTQPPTTEQRTTRRRGRPNTTRRSPTTEDATDTPGGTSDDETTPPPDDADRHRTDPPSATTTRSGDDDSLSEAAASAAASLSAPALSPLRVSGVGRRTATVTYSSDQCVATRFTLAGADAVQRGSSPGFDPAAECWTAWRLDFGGSSALRPDTAYTLRIWVRAETDGPVSSAEVSFRTLA